VWRLLADLGGFREQEWGSGGSESTVITVVAKSQAGCVLAGGQACVDLHINLRSGRWLAREDVKVETPIHDSIRELVSWESKEHGVKS
jgi:hypothetical protein